MDRLRALGNAVVPRVISHAWRDLLRQAEQTRQGHTGHSVPVNVKIANLE
jgi:hypothetical protein